MSDKCKYKDMQNCKLCICTCLNYYNALEDLLYMFNEFSNGNKPLVEVIKQAKEANKIRDKINKDYT